MRDTVRGGLRRSLSSKTFLATTVCVALLSLSACGGGGGGGGGSSTPPPSSGSNPPPPPPAATNTAPTVNAGADQSVQLPAAASLAGSATDAENNALTYAWTATGPADVTFDDAAAASTVAHFTAAGAYTLTLTANDGSLSGSDTVAITVADAATPPPSDAVFPAPGTSTDPFRGWQVAANPADVGLDATKLTQAQQYSGDTSSGAVIYKGRVAYYWAPSGAQTLGLPLFDVKSTTKSMGGVTLGLALDQQLVSLNAKAADYFQGSSVTFGQVEQPAPPAAPIPPNDPTLLSQITMLQLATHTSAFAKTGGYCQLLPNTVPGTVWAYSDCGLNWLADALTNAFHADLATVAQQGVWDKIGILPVVDITWRDNLYRPDGKTSDPKRRELAAGIKANINAMARVGLLFLNDGNWNGVPVLSKAFVDSVHTPPDAVKTTTNSNEANYPLATSSYGMLWWTNMPNSGGVKPMPNVPDDAYWAWGLGDSLIVVIPSKQLVIARAQTDNDKGLQGRTVWDGQSEVYLQPFIQPIVESVQ